MFWEGRVNRSDLMDPVRGASRYLAQLRSVADGILDREDPWIAYLRPFASAPTPARRVNLVTLRSVVGAIRRSEAIEVKCQPLSSPEPRWRCIAPRAIAFDGFRWHTRAFCLNDECFEDFLLSRLIEIQDQRESKTSADDDRDWHWEVTLEVGPHPSSLRRRRSSSRSTMDAGRQGEDQGSACAPLRAQAARLNQTGRQATAGSADRALEPRRSSSARPELGAMTDAGLQPYKMSFAVGGLLLNESVEVAQMHAPSEAWDATLRRALEGGVTSLPKAASRRRTAP